MGEKGEGKGYVLYPFETGVWIYSKVSADRKLS